MAERSIASDCKSDASRLRVFKSHSPQTYMGPLASRQIGIPKVTPGQSRRIAGLHAGGSLLIVKQIVVEVVSKLIWALSSPGLERLFCTQEVIGSTPIGSKFKSKQSLFYVLCVFIKGNEILFMNYGECKNKIPTTFGLKSLFYKKNVK